jgi:hypothetical protein
VADIQKKGASIDDMLDPAQVEDDVEPIGFRPASFKGGTPKFDKSDLAYPRVRLAQQQTPEVAAKEANAGDFVMTGFEALPRITIVPLLWAKTRLYAVGNGNDRKVLCSSADAEVGIPSVPPDEIFRYGGVCEQCPAFAWTPKPGGGGKNNPPACDENHNYIVYVIEHNMLAEMRFKKTGIKTAQMMNTVASGRAFGYFAVELYGTKPPNAPMPYWAPVGKVISRISDDLLKQAHAESLDEILVRARLMVGLE